MENNDYCLVQHTFSFHCAVQCLLLLLLLLLLLMLNSTEINGK